MGDGSEGAFHCTTCFVVRLSDSMAWTAAWEVLGGLTFRLATKSAVSSNVNWLIWSTMPLIFGSIGAADVDASVLEHRLGLSGLRFLRREIEGVVVDERRRHLDGVETMRQCR